MRTAGRWLLVVAMMVVAGPAFSNEIMQIWQCEMNPGTTEEDVEELARDYLKAVTQMDGGEGFKIRVFFPVVVNNTGQTDFSFVALAPSFTDWGKFWDAYNDTSPAAKADEMSAGKVVCPDSALWEVVNIEAK